MLERAAPLALLYALHPHPPVAASAHKLFCAILRHVDAVSALKACKLHTCLAIVLSA